MQLSRRDLLKSLAAVALLGSVKAQVSEQSDPLLQLLNRTSYGVRPADLEHARAIGLEAFLEQQLHPDTLDDSDADERLAEQPLLRMDRATLFNLEDYQGRCYRALIKGMLERATYSKRQLLERMVEFWSDHFNVPADFDLTPDIILFQQQLRQHALGNFRDLLFASAQAPAMLYYLNNASNIADAPNENYARELLELHTVGVDAAYSEKDVKEIARAFTGWTTHKRTRDGFYFNPYDHDRGSKQILGHNLPADRGIEDGLHVLSILNAHPDTARFVCTKLCRRFVSDVPPQRLVDQLVAVWAETDGELVPVLRALFLSAEFRASAGQKFKRPLHFFIGALRATGTTIEDFWNIEESLKELAQLPYGWHPPDGYPDVAGAWMTTNGLLSRWNTAMKLTHGVYSDAEWGWNMATELLERIPEVATAGELVAEVSKQVFGDVLDAAVLEPFIQYASDGAGAAEPVTTFLLSRKLGSLYGLMLASPAYQWT